MEALGRRRRLLLPVTRATVVAALYALLIHPEASIAGAAAAVHPAVALAALTLLISVNPVAAITASFALIALESLLSTRDCKSAVLLFAYTVLPLAASIAAAVYIYRVYTVVVNPPGLPPIAREAISTLFSSPTARFATALSIVAVAAYLAARFTSLLAEGLASGYAVRQVILDYILVEAEAVREARAWYHRSLAASLAALVSLPTALFTNAVIAVVYSRLELLAPPPPGIRQALAAVRAGLSILVFVVIEWVVYRWVKSMLTPQPRRPKPPYTLLALIALLAAALVASTPESISGLTPYAPPPPTPTDYTLSRLIDSIGAWLERSESMLRALLAYLWGS